MSNEKKLHFETLQLHVGQEQPDPATDARAVPIYQTTSYVFRNSQHAADRFGLRDAGNIYGRLTNSTQGVFEDRVAALEGGVAGLAVASGAAAITYALQNIARNGDHIIAANNLYGGTYNLIEHTLSTQGVAATIVDPADFDEVERAFRDNTKVIIIETFGNPNASVTNIDRIAEIAHRHSTPVIVDNTFGTPYLIRPIEHGSAFCHQISWRSWQQSWRCNRGWRAVQLESQCPQIPLFGTAGAQLSWCCVRRCGRCGSFRYPHTCGTPARYRCRYISFQRMDIAPRTRNAKSSRRAACLQHAENSRTSCPPS